MRVDITELIDGERARQEVKFGGKHAWGNGTCANPCLGPIVKSGVLQKECGEVARAVLHEYDNSELAAQLVIVAAVCTAWLEALL